MAFTFNLSDVPFSCRGSYLAVSRLGADRAPVAGLWLRCVRELFGCGPILRIELGDEQNNETKTGEPLALEACPVTVTATAESGTRLEMAFEQADTLRLRVRGGVLRLHGSNLLHMASPLDNGGWRLVSPRLQTLFWLVPLRGELTGMAPWNGIACDRQEFILKPKLGEEVAELALVETVGQELGQRSFVDFASCQNQRHREFSEFTQCQLPVAEKYRAASELAAYINWSSLVRPAGHLRREAMYMSKNWMTAVWSWDHAFNALAQASGHPELAWDQFMIMFDDQNEQGCLPGLISDRERYWPYVKPPVHGFLFDRLLNALPSGFCGSERLREAYDKMSAQAVYWLEHRDPFKRGLPVYWHGNDSGWDNSTVMLAGTPVVATDTVAYLVRHTKTLAELANRLGKANEADKWRGHSDRLLETMLDELWTGDSFAMPSLCSKTSRQNQSEGDSLLPFMTLVLGRRMPVDIRRKLVAGLTRPGRFMTDWGLASESLASPWYENDGYWRGPIWAPSTLLAVEGLREFGEDKLAARLARGFCDMCASHGFAENFDARTGQGLRDRGYTWTSSVFLWLANSLVTK